MRSAELLLCCRLSACSEASAWITGAGSGVGRAACVLFARHGAKVLALDIGQDGLDETVAAVTTQTLTDYLARRKKEGLAASSARVELVALKIFFRWLAARGKRVGDPAEPILPPRQEKHLPATMNEEDARKLVESITGNSPLDRRDRAILELFYASGLRLAELVQVRLD